MYRLGAVGSIEIDANQKSILAEHYISDGAMNRRRLRNKKATMLKDVAKVIQIIIFGKKQMQCSENRGVPLYSGSEIIKVNPIPSTYLNKQFVNNFPYGALLEKNWILLTLSGTVGSVGYVDHRFEGTFVTDDAMRIIAKKVPWGFLYSLLKTTFYKDIIENLQYGTVVKHINYKQIEELPIPKLNSIFLNNINKKIEKCSTLRSEADLLYKDCIDKITKSFKIEYTKSIAFKIRFKDIYCNKDKFTNELRFESDYYSPMRIEIQREIENNINFSYLGDLSNMIKCSNIRERIFVKKGIPFITGQNLNQLRLDNLKNISKKYTKKIDTGISNKDEILTTCLGSIGKTEYCHNNIYQNVFPSQQIIRISIDKKKIHPGYVYLFLSSKLGQEQLLKYKTGSVIEWIRENHVASIRIPIPNDKGLSFGSIANLICKKRQEAHELESDAIMKVERELTKWLD